MLIFALVVMVISLSLIGLWLNVVVAKEEGKDNVFQTYLTESEYVKFLKYFTLGSAAYFCIIFYNVWIATPVVLVGAYYLYNKVKPSDNLA